MTIIQEMVFFFICVLAFSGWRVYRAEKKKPRDYRG
jgi:cbb3-type cytochrome oxidase subunit 3